MPAPEGSTDQPNATATNGASGDPVQEKLAALLDNVTVGMTERAQAPASTPLQTPESREMAAPSATSTTRPAVLPEVAQITAQIKSIQAAAERTGSDAVLEGTPKASQAAQVPPGAVTIKGRGEGIAIEIGKGAWPELLEHLNERLAQSASFFRGGSVALDVGGRPLLESEVEQMRTLLEQHGMKLGVIRTQATRTFEAAVALGITAKLETAEGVVEAEIEAAESNWANDRHFVYRGNLRAGQVLQRQEHILVIGDINPGAEIVSHGDILVWGRLRGIAHAGAGGDRRSVVVALNLEPIQLRIAGVFAVADGQTPPAGGRWVWKGADKRPEVAHLAGDTIVVEPWDESKPGGLSAYRRSFNL